MDSFSIGGDFLVIEKRYLQDKRLSWKARGLLAYMLSLPEEEEISVKKLEEESPKEGSYALGTALKELVSHGYIKREQRRSADGRQALGSHYVLVCESGFALP